MSETKRRQRKRKKKIEATKILNKILAYSFYFVFLIAMILLCYSLFLQIVDPGRLIKTQTPQQQINPAISINSTSDTGLLIQLINQTGGIPIKVTSSVQTNWSQFIISLFFGSIFLLWIFGDMLRTGIKSLVMHMYFKALRKKSGRHILFIKHTEQGLFSGSMIDQNTLNKIQRALIKFKGKPFDLILHTPGGEVFASMFISRLFKEYPGKINAIIPIYAMSGGTMLALSADEVHMSETACLGPVDPQLGSLFKYGSAKSWDKIVKYKGRKAEDQSISFAMMGNQYTTSIKNHLMNTISLPMNPQVKKKFVNFLTSGEVEHAFALTAKDLNKLGVPVKIIKDKNLLIKMIKYIVKAGNEGVTYE